MLSVHINVCKVPEADMVAVVGKAMIASLRRF
jgi:hypothetical protein